MFNRCCFIKITRMKQKTPLVTLMVFRMLSRLMKYVLENLLVRLNNKKLSKCMFKKHDIIFSLMVSNNCNHKIFLLCFKFIYNVSQQCIV